MHRPAEAPVTPPPSPKPLTVGIPIRDEGQDFALCVSALAQALDRFPPETTIEVLVCVNGSSDAFAEAVGGMLQNVASPGVNWSVIRSDEGKLNAMQEIIRRRTLSGYLAFIDSDVVLAPNVLLRLWETLETEPGCAIAYGQPVPIFPAVPNTVHRLTRIHYALRERAYHRPYFHGRAFVMREWLLDTPRPHPALSSRLIERLRLDRGPIVDDIAISRMAIARWGADCIREALEANVYFDPPDDLGGLYAGKLRVAMELARLDLLYPHHALLGRSHGRSSWKAHGIRHLSGKIRTLHAIHRLMDAGLQLAAKMHVGFIRWGILKHRTLWVHVPGSKQFARHRRDWRHLKRQESEPANLLEPKDG